MIELLFLTFFVYLACTFAMMFYNLEQLSESYHKDQKRRYARFALLSPAWPVLLLAVLLQGVIYVFKTAFGKE